MKGSKSTRISQEECIYLEDGTYIRKEESVYIDQPFELAVVDILKSNSDSHLVFGWANVALQADGTEPLDWQGDQIPPEVLEKAAYQFVLKYRQTGEMHEGDVKGHLVESVMFTKDKMSAIGIPEGTVPEGWWTGFYIPDDEVCAKIKSGQYKMFSIQGKAKRLKV